MLSRSDLTQERLKELLHYDPETGAFHWRADRRPNIKAGQLAGSVTTKGYVQIMINQVNHLAHRLAWLYVHGDWPADQLDHKNRNKADNRIDNLRPANDSQNQQNKPPVRKSGRLMGATWSKPAGRWMAQIKIGGERKYLGLFDTEAGAHQAYLVAKRELHEFSTL